MISRNPILPYTNLRGDEKLCELYANDAAGDFIRITIFNGGVERFHNIVAPGTTYYFSSGRVKRATFGQSNTDYESTFGEGAEIRKALEAEEISAIFHLPIGFVGFR